jgi:pimeloyl-ACP methyl ester carboxylesterase
MVKSTYDTAGSKDLPVLVLIHGATVNRKMWLSQLREFSDCFYVIAPDLPGHGTLSHLPFTFEALKRVIVEVIEREARGSALLAGLSFGGYAAMCVAEECPDMVLGLILSGCSLNFRGVLGLYLRFVSKLMRIGWLKQSRERSEEKARQMFPPDQAEAAEATLRAGVFPEMLAPAFEAMVGKDFTRCLAHYPGPGLILNGEYDLASRRGEEKFATALDL